MKNSAQYKLTNQIIKNLAPFYEHDPIEIDYNTPFNLIVGTILSAQCTDKRVNEVTKKFFNKYKKPSDYLMLEKKDLENMIRSTGFFRNKAKNILGTAKLIWEKHNGKIPDSMSELTKLPGFGRKTANVILTTLFKKNEGICVDTHVLRLAKRLGLTQKKDAIGVEKDLMAITNQKKWHQLSHFLVLHGRRVCFARNPNCKDCVLNPLCPKIL